MVLYTYGRKGNPNKPNQETGIALHAATGNVNVQAQSDAMQITASQDVDISSTHGAVRITSPKSIVLTAAGAAIRISQGSIVLEGPRAVEFRASMKVLAGGRAASQSLALKAPGALAECPTQTVYVVTRGGSAL